MCISYSGSKAPALCVKGATDLNTLGLINKWNAGKQEKKKGKKKTKTGSVKQNMTQG